MTTGYYYAIFPFCGGGKKKRRQKNKGIYDWATTGVPVIKITEKAYKEHCTHKEIEITGGDFNRKETTLWC